LIVFVAFRSSRPLFRIHLIVALAAVLPAKVSRIAIPQVPMSWHALCEASCLITLLRSFYAPEIDRTTEMRRDRSRGQKGVLLSGNAGTRERSAAA
jgi:hypothetical protein